MVTSNWVGRPTESTRPLTSTTVNPTISSMVTAARASTVRIASSMEVGELPVSRTVFVMYPIGRGYQWRRGGRLSRPPPRSDLLLRRSNCCFGCLFPTIHDLLRNKSNYSRVELMQQRAALIGDLVASRRHADRRELQGRLRSALSAVDERVPPVQPLTITIGDEFQALYRDLAEALGAALRVRVALHGTAAVRIGIGWGELLLEEPERSPFGQDGPCWWRARDALDSLGDGVAGTACLTGGQGDELIGGYLVLQDHILSSIDERDATILIGLLDGVAQTELAKRLGVNKSSVSRRARNHGLVAVAAAEPTIVPVGGAAEGVEG